MLPVCTHGPWRPAPVLRAASSTTPGGAGGLLMSQHPRGKRAHARRGGAAVALWVCPLSLPWAAPLSCSKPPYSGWGPHLPLARRDGPALPVEHLGVPACRVPGSGQHPASEGRDAGEECEHALLRLQGATQRTWCGGQLKLRSSMQIPCCMQLRAILRPGWCGCRRSQVFHAPGSAAGCMAPRIVAGQGRGQPVGEVGGSGPGVYR
jgi:hypothetical protein